MADITITGTALGTPLESLLMADSIEPGSDPSYALCKTIYLYHPLGGKMVDGPIRMAQSQPRTITVPNSPEEQVRDAFVRAWSDIKADEIIAGAMSLARIYGASALVCGVKDKPTDEPLTPEEIAKGELYFNMMDPLNTAGSLVLNQDPNAPDFQKPTIVSSQGQAYHPSRAVVTFHERPIYIAYSGSAFGYVGRSVFQRALFPLKTFVQTMKTDDLVTFKAGVLVAKMKPAGSIVDKLMTKAAALKRALLQEAKTGNVLSITPEEEIETLNMMNVDNAATMARRNVLENIAAAADMPAKLLNSETFAEGFGEGTEDAKHVARYVEDVRKQMAALYHFMDVVVQYRAWTPEFYATIQEKFPAEYGGVQYKTAFFEWSNSFNAEWPSLLIEPESEQAKTEDVKLKAIIAVIEVLLPNTDPDNKARLIQWAADNINENKVMFSNPLELDWAALADYVPPEPVDEPGEPKPFAGAA